MRRISHEPCTTYARLATEKESREHLKLQLARYLGEQPESTQALHMWMKRLEAAAMGIISALFIAAMYISIAWKSVPPQVIHIAWFLFAASAAPLITLVGSDTLVLRAFPPVLPPGRLPKFVTGSGAVWTGRALISWVLVLAVFRGFYAYAVGTFNLVHRHDHHRMRRNNRMLRVEIRVKGQINEQWSDWLGGLTISYSDPDETILTGTVPDQAALYGIISRLRDMGLSIHALSSEENVD